MIARFLRSVRVRIIVFDIVFLLIGAVGYFQMVQKPQLPLTLAASEEGVRIIKSELTLVEDKRIAGAVIASLNGVSVQSKEDVEFLCDGLTINSSVHVELLQAKMNTSLTLTLKPFYSVGYLLSAALVALFFFGMGLFVFFKRLPDDVPALIFHHVMMGIFALIVMTWGSFTVPAKYPGILVRVCFSAAYAFVPVYFIRFTFQFPRLKWKNEKVLAYALAGFSTLLTAGMSFSIYRAVTENSLHWFNLYERWFDSTRFYFAAGVLFALGNFRHSFQYSVEESERRKLRWIFLGTAIGALSFIFLWQIPQLFTSTGIVSEEYILLLITFIPLTYAFSILRYHAFNIDIIFRRTYVYAIVFLCVFALYAIIVGAFTMFAGKFSPITPLFVMGIVAATAAAAIQPLKERAQKFVDRRFFHVQYTFREAQENIAARLDKQVTSYEVVETVLDSISSLIPMKQLSFTWAERNDSSSASRHNEPSVPMTARTIQPEAAEKLFPIESQQPVMLVNTAERGTRSIRFVQELPIDKNITAVFPIRSIDKGIKGFVCLGRKKSDFVFSHEDISLIAFVCNQAAGALDRIELQNQLLLEKEEALRLKELNEMKSFFVSSVSHDLKTPLTSIRMFAELLQSRDHSREKSAEYLQIIAGESGRLSRLIDNVLDFAKMEKGIKQYHFDIAEVNELVRQVVRLMEYELSMNSFHLEVSLMEPDCKIFADADAVLEAVINLLSNAMKYSRDKKQIFLSTDIRDGRAVVSVRDEGIGIPEDQLEEIFKPFCRLQYKNDTSTAGTGLGLSIVKEIMTAHQGEVRGSSVLGAGSTFSLFFPIYHSGSTPDEA